MNETPPPTSEALDDFLLKARAASGLLKALSHETRLLMLCMLCQGEKTVTEIEQFLGIQQAVVSQQLARLRSEKVVQTRREGRQIYYRIADPQLAELISVLYKMYCGPTPVTSSQTAALTEA
ncbi:MAG: ArsR/SmtB family transcription factor [Agrobacterium albertimagni]